MDAQLKGCATSLSSFLPLFPPSPFVSLPLGVLVNHVNIVQVLWGAPCPHGNPYSPHADPPLHVSESTFLGHVKRNVVPFFPSLFFFRITKFSTLVSFMKF